MTKAGAKPVQTKEAPAVTKKPIAKSKSNDPKAPVKPAKVEIKKKPKNSESSVAS